MSIDLVNNDKQQLNHILVELLRTLDEVCQRYNIKYFVFAGTMLGCGIVERGLQSIDAGC